MFTREVVEDYVETCLFQLVVRGIGLYGGQLALFAIFPRYLQLVSTRHIEYGQLLRRTPKITVHLAHSLDYLLIGFETDHILMRMVAFLALIA